MKNAEALRAITKNTVINLFYDLDGEKREKMYIALNERRALLAKEQSVSDELKDIIEALEEDEK